MFTREPILERWLRGRKRRFAKPLYGLIPVSRVRIPPSPYFSFALYAIFPVRVISRRGFSFVQLIAGPFVWIFPFYGVLYNFMLSFCWGSCLTEEFFLFPPVWRMDR